MELQQSQPGEHGGRSVNYRKVRIRILLEQMKHIEVHQVDFKWKEEIGMHLTIRSPVVIQL